MSFQPPPGPEIRFTGTALGEDWRGKLINYVGLFAPDVRAKVTPATIEQIEILQQVAPSPLPAVFRDYLKMAGVNRGPLFPKFQATIGLDASLELYRETKPEELPEGVFLIGYGFESIYPELGLHVSAHAEQPPVVASDGDEIIYTLAESLSHLLFQQAFLGHEIMSYPVRRIYGMTRERHLLANVAEHCRQLGFKPHDFSDVQNYCGWREGAAVYIHQLQGGAGWVYLSGIDESGCLNPGDELSRQLELVFLRQEP